MNLNLNIESPRFKIGQICRFETKWKQSPVVVKKIIARDLLTKAHQDLAISAYGNYWYVMEPVCGSWSRNIRNQNYKFLKNNQRLCCHFLLNSIISKPDYFNDL